MAANFKEAQAVAGSSIGGQSGGSVVELNSPRDEDIGLLAEGWVFFAVKEEAQPFQRRHASLGRSPPSANGQILLTGMGACNARKSFQAAMDTKSALPGWIMTCGFAGGLDPALRLGDVGFDADLDFPLLERFAVVGVRPWKFHCADSVATTALEKAQLRQLTQADAVEMESGVIRQLARLHGIPSATVRVISDPADESLPLDFNSLMTPEMTLSSVRLARQLLLGPWKIPALLRFGWKTQKAASCLAESLSATLAF